jgi:fumarate hydratase class I
MTVIKQDDLIQSIADALQFISYYHPTDFIRAMRGAWEKEESPAAKAAAYSGAGELAHVCHW